MNVGEIEWTCTMQLTEGRRADVVRGKGPTPERALDELERRLASEADVLAGRLERVRAARAAVPLQAP